MAGHDGTCGHCGSAVRPGFDTCTGCGAVYRHGTAGFPAVLLGLAVMAGGALFLAVGALAS